MPFYYLCPEPDASHLQGLTLRLVDGGRKGRFYRKLSALPLESELTHLRYECDSWNEDNSLVPNNLTFQQLVVDASHEDELCAIAEALPRVEVSKKH